MSDRVIRVEDLVRRYGELEAVRGISFDVSEGEVFGFLGPNGAGKTTTINVLCTLLRPDGGRASVAGHDVVREQSAVRRSIGIVFQDPTLDDQLTGEQNLRFHGYAYGVPRSVLRPRMRELLELVGLWERRGDRVRTYSGGMKRRLEIVRGLLHRPRVLFLDEPTLGLDPQTRRLVWDYVLELRAREKITIFLTTHYMDEAEISDRIAIIDHGAIVSLDTPDRLKDAVGGDVVTLKAEDNEAAMEEVRGRYGFEPRLADESVIFNVSAAEEWLPGFVRGFSGRLLSIGVRRPTLDDVFVELTGHAIRDDEAGGRADLRRWRRDHRVRS